MEREQILVWPGEVTYYTDKSSAISTLVQGEQLKVAVDLGSPITQRGSQKVARACSVPQQQSSTAKQKTPCELVKLLQQAGGQQPRGLNEQRQAKGSSWTLAQTVAVQSSRGP